MIPTIETIVEDLVTGQIPKWQAVSWLLQHAEEAHRDLRDYFAAKALEAVLHADLEKRLGSDEIASNAYHVADAMLAERTGARR